MATTAASDFKKSVKKVEPPMVVYRSEDGLLTIAQTKSDKYSPRTWHNASSAHLTVAIADDFTTSGEKLTHKAAGDRYVAIPFGSDALQGARELFKHMRYFEGSILNVAGNGIYTFKKRGRSQDDVNAYTLSIMSPVHQHRPFSKVLSGGQTGADLSGIVAAIVLGIPAEMTMPYGLVQRHEDGIDRTHTVDEIVEQVMQGVARLQASLQTSSSRKARP